MMCASTVQVAALPGEVVSNTGKQNYCQRTEGRSRLGAYACSSDLWERPSVSFDSRDMGIGHSLLSTSYYNKFGQESRAASPAFFPSRA